MTNSKRVIILNNVDSPHITQAIFILKDDTVDEFSAVCEAERIVGECMYSFTSKKRRSRALPVFLLAAALTLSLLIYFFTA